MQIPLLNATTSPSWQHGAVVRYVGMIQDMFDPELYVVTAARRSSATGEVCLTADSFCRLFEVENHVMSCAV